MSGARSRFRPAAAAIGLAALAATLVLVLRPPRTPYLDLLRLGDSRAERAERTAAVAAYRDATRLRPGDPAAFLRLARVYLDWGRSGDALDALGSAERLGACGSNAATLDALWIEACTAHSDRRCVVAHSRSLLALDPSAADVRHTLAGAHVELGEWDLAQTEYEVLLRDDPGDRLAHERLGALLLVDDAAAIQHLYAAGTELADRLLAALTASAASDDPAYLEALLGRVQVEVGAWRLAAHRFERALAHNPAYSDAHAYLGLCLDQLGRMDEAREHHVEAVWLAPDSIEALLFMGLHNDRRGDTSAARFAYEAAYNLDPTNAEVCIEIGHTWAAEGRYVAAQIWLEEGLALRPDDPVLMEVLVRFYLDHNVMIADAGLPLAGELVALAPDDARAYDLWGWAALLSGDLALARDGLMAALALDPMLPSAHYHLGLLREMEGDPDGARASLVRALDLDTTGEIRPLVERALAGLP